MYGYLADLLVGIHIAYVAYVVIGQLLLWFGWARGWRWVRNPWFRWTHLAAIAFVALEEFVGMTCPLTDWERALRELAGQPFSGQTFLARLMHDVLFYQGPAWVFTAIHLVMAGLVLATFVLFPPRRFRRVPSAPGPLFHRGARGSTRSKLTHHNPARPSDQRPTSASATR
jgi:hypothetical protein